MQPVNPEILTWARETAGFSLEDAAEKLGLSSSARSDAVEKLVQFERGEKLPTRNQLAKFASVYRRPLLTFYMNSPPARGERGEDYRTLSATVSPRDNALLDALLRDIKARQEMVRSLLEDEDDTVGRNFVSSVTMAQGVERVAESISSTLGFNPAERQDAQRNIGVDGLFRDLRARAEDAGVFVLLVGDLGSHHSIISEQVFRGFAIADPVAPFVVINDRDAKSARSFTLLHELSHIWLGKTGVSGAVDLVNASENKGSIEQFCNDVASEILLPSSAFTTKPAGLTSDDKDSAQAIITHLAYRWCVSEPMVAYKLQRLGWITGRVYRALTAEYAARWASIRQRQQDNERDGGPSYYVVKQFKLGSGLIEVVRRTLRENLLTHTKAAKVLGVKPGSVETIVRNHERSRGLFVEMGT